MQFYLKGDVNFFPSCLPAVGQIMSCIILEMLPTGGYFLVMFWLKYYLTGTTQASLIMGRILGILIGIITAISQTHVFSLFFDLDEAAFSLVMGIFGFLNVVITTTVVYPPKNNNKEGV